MKKKILSFSLLTLISVSTLTFAAVNKPGYVSRDCSGAFAKESITVTWFGSEVTSAKSYHKLPNNEWLTYTSGGLKKTWRAYAGFVADPGSYNSYNGVKGVQGLHKWKRENRYLETRSSNVVTNCNLLTWGVSNW
ncbi:hypothetical protein [Spartinivicinus poritis]|uniref:Lactococcin 972 family bacteriocin n=1 Tax=Spartinivicinus poritis TaxID=2994640 RepID=A0ABT5U740_9GAMM|nr:hypothetical protein [Spartinivicinus sp. A2-2]MDE1462015.1 hypothetical protein [Spartinivicinus sp. A2-2]